MIFEGSMVRLVSIVRINLRVYEYKSVGPDPPLMPELYFTLSVADISSPRPGRRFAFVEIRGQNQTLHSFIGLVLIAVDS